MKEKKKKFTVYLIKENGVIRYVGETDNFEGNSNSRKYQHLNRRGTKYSAIPVEIDLTTIEITPIETYRTEKEAKIREGELILQYHTLKREGKGGWNTNRSGLIWSSNRKLYDKLYQQEHKEEISIKRKDYFKSYYQKPENKERQIEYYKTDEWKKWYREYRRQYRLEHREEELEKQRLYDKKRRELHRDKINAKRRERYRLKKQQQKMAVD